MNVEARTSETGHPRVVIVGAGFGGLQAALAIGKQQPEVDLTVIDRTNHHLFQPLLYQVATAALSPADISTPIRHVLRKQKRTEVIMAEVTGIDIESKRVMMADNLSIPYNYLIIATGAHENYFGHQKSWGPLAPGLKSIEDAQAIRNKILVAFEQAEIETDPEQQKKLLTFVVVGSGPTGVEMAGSMAELAYQTLTPEYRHIDPGMIHIILIEALPKILNAFPEKLARRAKKKLERLGVDVRTNTPLEEITKDGVVAGGQWIASTTIIWTAGVQASPAGQWLGAETDRAGRAKVMPDLSLPDYPEVFVLGDTANPSQDGPPLPGVAQVAMQQGRYVASVIKQRISGEPAPEPFHYHDKGNLATVGRAYAIASIGPIRISGFIAWIIWLTVHIVYLIGYENRTIVLLQWAWSYLLLKRRVRIITRSVRLSPPSDPNHKSIPEKAKIATNPKQ
ncbi:NADH dehydrogenase [Dictyobacter alpinus]|uniref:NADH:ubiquinone reductase (non-electrogenic) n=1 Tax=Dictyobacter alpinus TaxID=2014873 RepID=A0A402B9I6_9CHLR|nr:NAD(P)/FAD-dependent oxidoreductase [Dictyobacter alpinus]GCE28028.1 NADH dehydrogenase [Dictyobacter alpinus]